MHFLFHLFNSHSASFVLRFPFLLLLFFPLAFKASVIYQPLGAQVAASLIHEILNFILYFGDGARFPLKGEGGESLVLSVYIPKAQIIEKSIV